MVINTSGANEYLDFPEALGNDRLSEFEAFRHFEFPLELKAQLNSKLLRDFLRFYLYISFLESQSHISMGLFSNIHRAWMSIDSDLYLWRFDTK